MTELSCKKILHNKILYDKINYHILEKKNKQCEYMRQTTGISIGLLFLLLVAAVRK
jgi:hypothetical protein